MDMYTLFRFIRLKKFEDIRFFNENIARPIQGKEEEGFKRLRIVLKSCLIRRRKDTEIDGKPLIILPKREVIIDRCVAWSNR